VKGYSGQNTRKQHHWY